MLANSICSWETTSILTILLIAILTTFMFDKFPLQSEIAVQKSITGRDYEFFILFKKSSYVQYSYMHVIPRRRLLYNI